MSTLTREQVAGRLDMFEQKGIHLDRYANLDSNRMDIVRDKQRARNEAKDVILQHDQAQRDTIAALQQRVEELEKALMHEEYPTKHLIETRRCYHERNRIIRQLEQQLAAREAELEAARQAALSEGVRAGKLQVEVDAWRSGGVTEEILRRQDGYLKVGKGCVLVREDDWNKLNEELEVLRERDSGF